MVIIALIKQKYRDSERMEIFINLYTFVRCVCVCVCVKDER